MRYGRYCVVAVLSVALAPATGCNKGASTGTGQAASANAGADASANAGAGGAVGADAGATGAAATAGAGAAPTAVARARWSGEATGQGADPPIHEYVPRVQADVWHGTGTVSLEVPDGDGPVSGTLTLSGIEFRVNGFRTGAHVRGTLEQSGGDAGVGVDGGERGEEFYRGTLDAEIAADALRGTWEASAQAGMHRRRGTITAHR